MTDALRLTFDVGCPPEQAFEIRTARTSTWWPASHTVSARPGVETTAAGPACCPISALRPADDSAVLLTIKA